MTFIFRAKLVSDGYTGGPGVNVLHFTQGVPPITMDEMAQAIADELEALVTGLAGTWINTCQIHCPDYIDVIDVATGDIVDQRTVPTPFEAISGANTTTLISRGYSVCVNLGTDTFLRGRRLRGRIFLGPAGYSNTDANGQITSANQAFIPTQFDALISGVGPRLAVYHRPTVAPPYDSEGSYGDVVNVSVAALPSDLRSRKR